MILSLDPQQVLATMSSTNYQISWDSVGVGGSDTASSATYRLRDSLNFLAGDASSTSYQLSTGYRAGVYDRVADFSVVSQLRSSAVAALSATSTTVTVTSTAGFSVGDYIVVVANEGEAQIAEMGQITLISSPIITVDAFNGAGPSIDGSNDLVYRLSGSALNLGTMTAAAVSTTIIGWEVTADVAQGYSVYVMEDQDLRNADLIAISDVSDGTVSVGVGEYGAKSSDLTLASSTFDSVDTALTSSLQQVASRDNNSFSTRDFLTLKVAPSTTQATGSYTQTLSLIYVGDY
jgi:hypothetical protein